MTSVAAPTSDLKRELGLFDAVMINAGTMIASAIFIVPATVAAAVQGTAVMTLVWVIGGIVSLLGALSVAELAAAYPEAGGQYAYLREAYGTVWAFLYGWSNFSVINTASITAIAVGFARYIGFFTPLSESGTRIIAIISIIGLTLLNCRGVRLGATTQNVLTTLKIGALIALIVTSFVIPGGSVSHFQPLWPSAVGGGGGGGHWIGAFGVAMVAVLWAYDGWIETTYVGSEIVNPGRNLPRSIILSTVMVMVLFVLASVAFVYVLGPGGMAGSALVASDAAKVTMGSLGATLVVAAILISTLGANNGIILTAARIPYAMARQALFFRAQGLVHPRYGTPIVALVTQGVIASVLTLVPRCVFGICSPRPLYDQLATYVVFAQFVFYALSAGAVIRLRRKAPHLERPYRTWGYPVTPIVFIAFAIWLVANTIVETPKDSAIGAGLILLGLPGYFYWRRAATGGAKGPPVDS
jgi:APA family basic amino acid/polyamine antiporter